MRFKNRPWMPINAGKLYQHHELRPNVSPHEERPRPIGLVLLSVSCSMASSVPRRPRKARGQSYVFHTVVTVNLHQEESVNNGVGRASRERK